MSKYFTIIAAFILTGYLEPFRDPAQNTREMFNEAVTMVVLYHTLCFTPFVWDPYTKHLIGYSVILTTTIHIYVNLHIISAEIIRASRISYMMYNYRKGLKEHRKENRQKFQTGITKSIRRR